MNLVASLNYQRRFSLLSVFSLGLLFVLSLPGCVGPTPGPDKQGEGMLLGAATGAGAGAVTGAQVASATGPGIAIGAGIGAVAGSIRGAMQDQFEEELLRLSRDTRHERERAFAQELLADHYERRKELHPTRDIFPADVFFKSDEVELRPSATPVLAELIRIHQNRFGWSRFSISAYVKSETKENDYAFHLARKRSEALGNELTRLGIEPRRIVVRGILIKAPILIDPLDHPMRYNAAIEFAPIDIS